MAVKKKAPQKSKGAPLWMTTYGDMMTLLLCFFVLLFSFSTIDVVKFKEVIVELQGALGVLSGGPMVLNMGDIPQRNRVQAPTSHTRSQISEVKEKIEAQIEDQEMEGDVDVNVDERGLRIRFSDKVLFDLGSATLKPGAVPILSTVGREITNVGNNVVVEGHTDNWPIHTPEFPSNWELSCGRAAALVHFFIEESAVEPTRLSAVGYSQYHPIAPNDSPENKARNRRVDVIILLGAEEKESLEMDMRADKLNELEMPGAFEGIIMEEESDQS